MKHYVKLIAMTLALVFMCTAFVSCGVLFGPNKDPQKAGKQLENKGYTVEIMDDELSIRLLQLRTGLKEISCYLTAESKKDADNVIEIYYFKSEEAAKTAWEQVEKYAENALEEDKSIVIKQAGNMLWMGTKKAVNAAA